MHLRAPNSLVRLAGAVVAVSALCGLVGLHPSLYARTQTVRPPKAFIPYPEAAGLIEAFRQTIPDGLRTRAPADMERAWPEWVRTRDQEIRARLARGDEDSVVYLWLYGTSFTTQAPLTGRNTARVGADDVARLAARRLDDLMAGVVSPGSNDRLRFAREVVERQGIDVSTAAGQVSARVYLDRAHERVLREHAEQTSVLESLERLDTLKALAAYATLFRDRGLSSDTSLLPCFGVEQALDAMKRAGVLAPDGLRRVAIVGPGLDFANKDDGYDFYPQQTIQPFALMDSLAALGLGAAGITVATFDPNPRVNGHIEAAVERARAGERYAVHLPLPNDPAWNPELVAFWGRFGLRIGSETSVARSRPAAAAAVTTRAVNIAASRVVSIVPHDLDIVLERLDLAEGDRFDLIVATNVLVYYDTFEQTLALANIRAMLRDGGIFLSNTPVPPIPSMTLSERVVTVPYSSGQRDHLFWYQRQPRVP